MNDILNQVVVPEKYLGLFIWKKVEHGMLNQYVQLYWIMITKEKDRWCLGEYIKYSVWKLFDFFKLLFIIVVFNYKFLDFKKLL